MREKCSNSTFSLEVWSEVFLNLNNFHNSYILVLLTEHKNLETLVCPNYVPTFRSTIVLIKKLARKKLVIFLGFVECYGYYARGVTLS